MFPSCCCFAGAKGEGVSGDGELLRGWQQKILLQESFLDMTLDKFVVALQRRGKKTFSRIPANDFMPDSLLQQMSEVCVSHVLLFPMILSTFFCVRFGFFHSCVGFQPSQKKQKKRKKREYWSGRFSISSRFVVVVVCFRDIPRHPTGKGATFRIQIAFCRLQS
jgi:hypothetical protein